MPLQDQDPSLIQDFLTESGELIDQLDTDLLELEGSGQNDELLNSVFRALHTIKGAASFLDLGNVTSFAHSAEFALDKLRKGEVGVDGDVVDVLLRSVDVLKGQLGQIEDGTDPDEAPADLVSVLDAISSGGGAAPTADAEQSVAGGEGPDKPAPAQEHPLGATATPLELPAEKLDVMPYMVEDLRESLSGMSALLDRAETGEPASSAELAELARSTETTADFFDLEVLRELINLFAEAGDRLPSAPSERRPELIARLRAALLLMQHAADGLAEQLVYGWEVTTFCDRCILVAHGSTDDGATDGDPQTDPLSLLEAEGVVPRREQVSKEPSGGEEGADEPATAPESRTAPEPASAQPNAPTDSRTPQPDRKADQKSSGDTTIRVEVARLETLMNLVGEMTLTKNQVIASTREIRRNDAEIDQELAERMSTAASDLDRLTSELQQCVMRTRMQPLEKLFGRYPRIVRDLAKKTDKSIELRIEGGDTEVDKSVLELLGDPLVHMLRNSVDHGIENTTTRRDAGKPETGTLWLRAEHQGGHVRIVIEDDGRGIDRSKIAAKAVERGLVTRDEAAALSDEEVFRFIFAPGFSTAEQVSDLSGRGVGMDVVNSNIKQLNGMVNINSTLGAGTTIEIMIPLTVATMSAMVVGVGDSDYAIPLSAIEEITRSGVSECSTVRGRPVIRVRDEVIGLVDMRRELIDGSAGRDDGFVVIVAVGQEKAGLIVDRLIGQQEVVIKVLDDDYTSTGPFSGATIREDGRVNLILDIVKLLRDNARTKHTATD